MIFPIIGIMGMDHAMVVQVLLNMSFFHHYQESIDFNTVNIHRNVGMYFFVSSGNRDDIE